MGETVEPVMSLQFVIEQRMAGAVGRSRPRHRRAGVLLAAFYGHLTDGCVDPKRFDPRNDNDQIVIRLPAAARPGEFRLVS